MIQWVGPSLGAILAAVIYRLLITLHYWELVPDATATSAQEAAHQNTEPARAIKTEHRNADSVV